MSTGGAYSAVTGVAVPFVGETLASGAAGGRCLPSVERPGPRRMGSAALGSGPGGIVSVCQVPSQGRLGFGLAANVPAAAAAAAARARASLLFRHGLQFADRNRPTLSPANPSDMVTLLTSWASGGGGGGGGGPSPASGPAEAPSPSTSGTPPGAADAGGAPPPPKSPPRPPLPSVLQLSAGATAFRGRNANVGSEPIEPFAGPPSAYMQPQYSTGTLGWYMLCAPLQQAAPAAGAGGTPGSGGAAAARQSFPFSFFAWRVQLCSPEAAEELGYSAPQSAAWVVSGGYTHPGTGTWVRLQRATGAERPDFDAATSPSVPLRLQWDAAALDVSAVRDPSTRPSGAPAGVVRGVDFQVRADGGISLKLAADDVVLDAEFQAQGGEKDSAGTFAIPSRDGCAPCAFGTGSLYYSQPFLCCTKGAISLPWVPASALAPATAAAAASAQASAQAPTTVGNLTDGAGWLDHQWSGPQLELAAIPELWALQAAATLVAWLRKPTATRWLWLSGYTDDGYAHMAVAPITGGETEPTARGGQTLPCLYFRVSQDGTVERFVQKGPTVTIYQVGPSLPPPAAQEGVAFARAVRLTAPAANVDLMWTVNVQPAADPSAGTIELPHGVINLEAPSVISTVPSGGTGTGTVVGSGLLECNGWGTDEMLTRAAVRAAGIAGAGAGANEEASEKSAVSTLVPKVITFGEAAPSFFSLTGLGLGIVLVICLVLWGVAELGLHAARRARAASVASGKLQEARARALAKLKRVSAAGAAGAAGAGGRAPAPSGTVAQTRAVPPAS